MCHRPTHEPKQRYVNWVALFNIPRNPRYNFLITSQYLTFKRICNNQATLYCFAQFSLKDNNNKIATYIHVGTRIEPAVVLWKENNGGVAGAVNCLSPPKECNCD